jgi:putative transcriptional regulator
MDNRLTELRAAAELSQQALADRVGVSRQTINSLEGGRYNPSLELAVKIARTFGLPVEEVFHVEDHAHTH